MSRRTFTDDDRSDALKLLEKVRRTASDDPEGNVLYNSQATGIFRSSLGHKSLTLAFMRSQLHTLDQLRKTVVELIVHRLQGQNVQFPPLNVSNMSCQNEEPAWRLLLEDPISFTAHMLEAIIALDVWTADTPNPSVGANLLYIRTFQIPASFLQTILNEIVEEGFDTNDRVQFWQKRIDEEATGDVLFTLRYCGQTTGNPWERHRGDMYGKLSTFFGRFLKVLGKTEEGRKVLHDVKIHTVAGAITPVSEDTSNLREQILIALFGDCALNTQAGGKDVITLFKEDRDNFDRLRTQTGLLLMSETRAMTEEESSWVEEYARAVQKYTGKNPNTLGSGEFTEGTRLMIVRQGVPSVLKNSGFAVMVTLGSDLGEDHESTEDTFWNAGGRSADAVSRVYNFFSSWEGPTALEAVDPYTARNLASSGHLPFADVFPWFTKEEKDYLKASDLLRRYMNATKPLIVLAYGYLQTFAGIKSFADFTKSEFGSWTKMCRNYGSTPPRGQPILSYFDGSNSGHHDPATATVLIPSFHPGYLSRSGMVKEKATRIFVLTSVVAWCAMSCALTIAKEGEPVNREEYASMIIARVHSLTGPSTMFGQAMESARKEYEDCYQAYLEGSSKRRKAPKLRMPAGVLPQKSIRAQRKSRYDAAGTAEEGIGGWEIAITKAADFSGINEFYNLTWIDDIDKKSCKIGPLPLSNDVVSDTADKRYLYFVSGGLDIRDCNGKSLGTRTPLSSKASKTITLPISGIFLAMGVQSLHAAYEFLEYWESLTGNFFVDEIMSAHKNTGRSQPEALLPLSFFDRFPEGPVLPFPSKTLSKASIPKMKAKMSTGLPVKPNDLLWLLEQFLTEVLPNGGEIDPISTSEHPTYSIYTKLMQFANRAKYKHHAHINTLKSMAHLSEQGADDRRVSYNILLLALDYLRQGNTQKKKNLKRTLPDGFKIETTRMVRIIGAGPALASVVSPLALPQLVDEVEQLGEVEDVTDDEDLGDAGDDDDDDGDDDDGDDDDGDDDGDGNDSDDGMDLDPKSGPQNKRKNDDGKFGGPGGYGDAGERKFRFGAKRTQAI
ncbi:unnamed protein product [Alternaria alternata]